MSEQGRSTPFPYGCDSQEEADRLAAFFARASDGHCCYGGCKMVKCYKCDGQYCINAGALFHTCEPKPSNTEGMPAAEYAAQLIQTDVNGERTPTVEGTRVTYPLK